jgi:chromosome segregation ATPase
MTKKADSDRKAAAQAQLSGLDRLANLDAAIEAARLEITKRQSDLETLKAALEAERRADLDFTEEEHEAQQVKLDAAQRAITRAKERHADLLSMRPAAVDAALPELVAQARENVSRIDGEARTVFDEVRHGFNSLDASMLEFRRLYDEREKVVSDLTRAHRDVGRTLSLKGQEFSVFPCTIGDLYAALRHRVSALANPLLYKSITVPAEARDLKRLLHKSWGEEDEATS